jgi:hypothetical protein
VLDITLAGYTFDPDGSTQLDVSMQIGTAPGPT